MLSKEEENRLNAHLDLIKFSKREGVFPKLSAYDIEWIAKKLTEKNDELAQVHAELQKTNEELANYVQRYEG